MGRLDKLKRQAVNEANKIVLGEQDDDDSNITRAFSAHSRYNTHKEYFKLLDECGCNHRFIDLIDDLKKWDTTDREMIDRIGDLGNKDTDEMLKVDYTFIGENTDPCDLWCYPEF
jgi:hypothetical protein